ncbi:MAG TPA: hypothetical protein VM118_05790, partial [Acidobacteriota bacterium]|nr:hypothetical protein [Acidobacteriota bacterium]
MIRPPNTIIALTRRAARLARYASAVVLGPTLLVWGVLLTVAPDVAMGATPAARQPVGWNLDLPPAPADAPSWNDTVPGSNTIIDLIYREPNLWAATARGVSRLTLPGEDWLSYGTEDGLGGAEIPAMGVFRSGIWAATSSLLKLDNSSVARGNGIYLFDEGSGQWLDRSPTYELVSGGTVRQASGAAMLCYDMAEFRDGLVAACWAGGLVLSPDAGETWRNVFLDGYARGDFEEQLFNDLGNLYFSVVVDESAPESLAVYA